MKRLLALLLMLLPLEALAACVLSVSGTAPPGVVGTPYSYTPTLVNTCHVGIDFALQHRPAWVVLNTATGQITGVPTAAGTTSVTYWPNNNTSVHQTFNLVVGTSPPPPPTGTATVVLTPPSTNTDGTKLTTLTGMTLYYGTSPTALSNTVSLAGDTGTTTYVVKNLAAGTWYFAGTASASDGQVSAKSAVVSKVVSAP